MKHTLLLILFSLWCLSSCNKMSDTDSTDLILGKWKLVKAEEYDNGQLKKSYTEADFGIQTILFMNTGEAYQEENGSSYIPTYTISGGWLTLDFSRDFGGRGIIQVYKLNKLTKKELVLYVYNDEEPDAEGRLFYNRVE